MSHTISREMGDGILKRLTKKQRHVYATILEMDKRGEEVRPHRLALACGYEGQPYIKGVLEVLECAGLVAIKRHKPRHTQIIVIHAATEKAKSDSAARHTQSKGGASVAFRYYGFPEGVVDYSDENFEPGDWGGEKPVSRVLHHSGCGSSLNMDGVDL